MTTNDLSRKFLEAQVELNEVSTHKRFRLLRWSDFEAAVQVTKSVSSTATDETRD